MIDMSIPLMRERKKLREQRTHAFLLEIYKTVNKGNDKSFEELDKVNNEILLNPWYRDSYRSSSNYNWQYKF